MNTYLDKLAPWEKKRAYYNNIKPGNKIVEVKEALKKQTQKMITAQIPPLFYLRPNCRVSIWEVYWNAYRNMYNRRDSLLYMFVCERYIASVKMERD